MDTMMMMQMAPNAYTGPCLSMRIPRIYFILSSTLEAEKPSGGMTVTLFSFPNKSDRKGTSMVSETRENNTESRFKKK